MIPSSHKKGRNPLLFAYYYKTNVDDHILIIIIGSGKHSMNTPVIREVIYEFNIVKEETYDCHSLLTSK